MKVRAIPLSRSRSSQLVSTVPGNAWRFGWRNGRTGVGLPHGQPDGEDPQVARAREEVLAAPGAEARQVETDLA
jgi:hypothetical protein